MLLKVLPKLLRACQVVSNTNKLDFDSNIIIRSILNVNNFFDIFEKFYRVIMELKERFKSLLETMKLFFVAILYME